MNAVINQILSHRSIRKFKKRDIEEDILMKILEAATMASSSGNMQTYSIIVSKDHDVKKLMDEAHFKQPMLLESPVFLTFCADFNRMRRWGELSDAANNFDNFMSFMIASIDATLASQNAALAAESLGIGLCYMGTTLASASEIGRVLELPENVVPIVGFALGYPDEEVGIRKRLPLKSIIHYEKYRVDSDYEVLKTHEDKNTEGMKRYLDDKKLRKILSEKEITNLAQVYTQLKYTEESHILYSQNLLSYLKNQGFL
ncbi:MAG: NADPH-dependent oxidoreductase [Bacteriovorax sp. MedPE-SWde]|nr:MAG: NADPH-dependent oxidoreductase [Bacteriovorax sp. MedPE-SWde]